MLDHHSGRGQIARHFVRDVVLLDLRSTAEPHVYR